MDDKDLFIATGHALTQMTAAVQKALQTHHPIDALTNLVDDFDQAAQLWVTKLHEGRTLAQHWHDARKARSPASTPPG